MTSASPADDALSCVGLTVGYGGAPVLTKTDLRVPKQAIVGVLGRNGAGKTTLLETFAGVHRPSAGTVTLLGEDVTRLSTARRVRSHIALVPQGRRIVAGMSVRENLVVGAHTVPRRLVNQRIDTVCDLFPVLSGWLTRDGVSLSGGQQQIVAIARAVMSDPQVLLLDEPLTGLSPAMVDEVCDTIAQTKRGGAAVIIAEQNARAAVSIADDVVVISAGRIQKIPDGETEARLDYIQASFFRTHNGPVVVHDRSSNSSHSPNAR